MFAPAEFGDAEDTQPAAAALDIGAGGCTTPYNTAVTNLLQKHMEEIRGKASGAVGATSFGGWKRRLRDFLSLKNNDLLDFLKLAVGSHTTLGPGETLLKRFSNPNVNPNHASVRDMVMDASGEDVMGEINTILNGLWKEGGVKDYTLQTVTLFEEYRAAGDKVLSAQAALKVKLDRLDKIQGKLAVLFDIGTNEKLPPLMEASEAFLAEIFRENQIEEEYKALIAAYRRFAVLREVVTVARTVLAQESEPLCSICFQNSVAWAFVPCGHTLCTDCSRRQSGTCYMCRRPVREKIQIYFG
jgi:hypothetical protein